MKPLILLGVARDEKTTSCRKARQDSACFSPVASRAFLKPEEVIVLLTEDAQDWNCLR